MICHTTSWIPLIVFLIACLTMFFFGWVAALTTRSRIDR
jgi:hypothetical protein